MKIFKFIGKLIGIVLALFVVVIIIGVVVDDDESKSTTTTKTVKTKKVEGPVYTRENPNPITDFVYEFTSDTKGVKIIQYKGTSSSIIVPESIEGYPVREIVHWGLDWDKNPYNIYIPRSVKKLGLNCFYRINGNIDLDLENTELGPGCFDDSGVSGTLIITPTMFPTDGNSNSCFRHTKIEKLIVKEGVERIGRETFMGCENLTSITLPKSLRTIDQYAFRGCTSLTEVIVPEGKRISMYVGVFAGCTALPLTMQKKLIDYGYDGDFVR